MEFGQYAFAPLCTGYIWFSNTYSVHFLSERVHDEQVLMDSEVKWDELGIVAMFKGVKFSTPGMRGSPRLISRCLLTLSSRKT